MFSHLENERSASQSYCNDLIIYIDQKVWSKRQSLLQDSCFYMYEANKNKVLKIWHHRKKEFILPAQT